MTSKKYRRYFSLCGFQSPISIKKDPWKGNKWFDSANPSSCRVWESSSYSELRSRWWSDLISQSRDKTKANTQTQAGSLLSSHIRTARNPTALIKTKQNTARENIHLNSWLVENRLKVDFFAAFHRIHFNRVIPTLLGISDVSTPQRKIYKQEKRLLEWQLQRIATLRVDWVNLKAQMISSDLKVEFYILKSWTRITSKI